MGLLFGLLTAVSIGCSDLFGRRLLGVHGALTTGMGVQFVAIGASLLGLVFVPSTFSAADFVYGLVSGVGMGIGLWAYFGGLERSSSAVVAPLVATLSAVIPYTYALARGASPTTLSVLGAVVALLGLVVITVGGTRPDNFADGLRWGVISGLGYGIGLSVVIDASDAGGAWPAVGQRASGFLILLMLASRASVRLVPNAALRPWLLASGLFAALSTIFYLVGLEIDAPSTVITASLFPAMSVIVGKAIYHDHVAGHQVAGLGVVLIGMLGVGLG